jgi:hypothetical protein
MTWTFWYSTGEKFARFWRLLVIIPSEPSQMAQQVTILWRYPRHKDPQKKSTCIVPWTYTNKTYLQDVEASCTITWKLHRRVKTVMLLQPTILKTIKYSWNDQKGPPSTPNTSKCVDCQEGEELLLQSSISLWIGQPRSKPMKKRGQMILIHLIPVNPCTFSVI